MNTLRRTLLAAASLVVLSLGAAVPSTVGAQSAPVCLPGQSPAFAFGIAELQALVGAAMGDPLECEHTNPANGDTEQRTTTGLAYFRPSTNTPSFTDGYRHWALTPQGVLFWEGTASDPPENARLLVSTAQPTPPATGGRFTMPVVEALASDSAFPCVTGSEGCTPDEWWASWNTVQSREMVQYRFLGPGFAGERRYAEAILLLWQWPEGKTLLTEASAHGVRLTSARPEQFGEAFAAYTPRLRQIRVNPSYAEASTWMVADVIAHELQHALDHRQNEEQGRGAEDCVAREQRAYGTEQRFMRYLVERFGPLPTPQQVRTTLSGEDFELFVNLRSIANSRDTDVTARHDYQETCGL